jgi:hypothetical protein
MVAAGPFQRLRESCRTITQIFAGFDTREHARLITLMQRVAKQADLPDSIHADLRRRRRANV